MDDHDPAPTHVVLSRYADELQNHTGHDPEYRALIAGRFRDKAEEVRANDNQPVFIVRRP